MFKCCANGNERILVGMTTNFAVVGKPIAHSLSPLLHNACYSELGVDFFYKALEIETGSLLDEFERSQLSGCSVTMPLKEEAFRVATTWDKHSTMTSICNTLVRTEHGIEGFNTDVYGIESVLSELSDAKSILILGTGATAKSALIAAGEKFSEARLHVWGRNRDRVYDLVSFGQRIGFSCESEDHLSSNSVSRDLVISTLPGGVLDAFWESEVSTELPGWLLDVHYATWPTTAAGRFSEIKTLSGLEMLKWQAARQIEIFFQHFAPETQTTTENLVSIMNRALAAR